MVEINSNFRILELNLATKPEIGMILTLLNLGKTFKLTQHDLFDSTRFIFDLTQHETCQQNLFFSFIGKVTFSRKNNTLKLRDIYIIC